LFQLFLLFRHAARHCEVVKKSQLLKALREEIQRHNLDTFMSADKIVQTGCSTRQKHFGTIEQFKTFDRRCFAAAAG